MSRLVSLVLALALVLPAGARAEPAHRKAAAFVPDLYLVEGQDWRVVLPASVLAARGAPDRRVSPVILYEDGKGPWVRHLLEGLRPRRVAIVAPESGTEATGLLAEMAQGSSKRVRVETVQARPGEAALRLAERVLPAGEAPVWLVDAEDYPGALLAAVASGAEHGVLLPVGPAGVALEEALTFAADHGGRAVFAGAAPDGLAGAAETHQVTVETVATDRLVERAVKALSGEDGAPAHVVFANPADVRGYFSPPHLSVLAPLYALGKRAPLLLTSGKPDALEAELAAHEARFGPVTHATLVGDYLAIGLREMKDPDQVHRKKKNPRRFKVPLLAGVVDRAPAEYAVARLAAEDAYDLSLQVGRILAPRRLARGEKPVLLLSNADLKFIMAELISKATAKEMESLGLDVDAFYGARIDRDLIRKEIEGKQVVIWEGHPRDLTVDYEIGVVDQQLDAGLVFLQGCYTLDRNDPYVLVQQGAAAVAGTYMAVYSASGSAFAKAFFDAMLYQGADEGEAMMHARNYLLAYVELKRRRHHSDWRKTFRAALSFDLWGDPTARPLVPAQPAKAPPVRLVRDKNALRMVVPAEPWPTLRAGRYKVDLTPGAQLGSIYTHYEAKWGDDRKMQEVYFAWIDLPDFDAPPHLVTAISDRHWATVWAPKRHRLYLIVHNDAAEEVGRANLKFRLER